MSIIKIIEIIKFIREAVRFVHRVKRVAGLIVNAIARVRNAFRGVSNRVAAKLGGYKRVYPMRQGTYFLSSPFGPRDGGFHYGQDFGADDGTPIYAAQTGTVVYIGNAQGFGQWIVLDHSDTEGSGTTVYGHMWNAFATGLKQGDHVEAGQHIAYVGANGQSTGPHLHFEVHPTVWRAGSQIDPMPWLAGAGQP